LKSGRKLTAFYYTERYPPGPVPSYSAEETTQMLEVASELIKEITDRL